MKGFSLRALALLSLMSVNSSEFVFAEETSKGVTWCPENKKKWQEFVEGYKAGIIVRQMELAAEAKAKEDAKAKSSVAAAVAATVACSSSGDNGENNVLPDEAIRSLPTCCSVRTDVRAKINNAVDELETTYMSFMRPAIRAGAKSYLGGRFDKLVPTAKAILSNHNDEAKLRSDFCETLELIQWFLYPESVAMIQSKVTLKDIALLKSVGTKLLAEYATGRPFIQFVIDCQQMTRAEFRQAVIDGYGIDIDHKSHVGPNYRHNKACNALIDIFGMLCE